MEVRQMKIYELDGIENDVDVVTSFFNDNKSKQYVIYTKNEKQGDNTIIYISILNKVDGQNVLEEIDSDDEWTFVKNKIRELLA